MPPLNLLDTHTLIWFINGDNALSTTARQSIETSGAVNFVSIVSLWEISIKLSLGKLELNVPYSAVKEHIINNGFEILPITFEDTSMLANLPTCHFIIVTHLTGCLLHNQ